MGKVKFGYADYANYVFRKGEQDPVCDEFRTVLEQEFGRGDQMRRGAYAIGRLTTNVTASAMLKWIDGSTISPRHCKLGAALGAIGYEFKISKVAGSKIIKLETHRRSKRAKGEDDGARRRTA